MLIMLDLRRMYMMRISHAFALNPNSHWMSKKLYKKNRKIRMPASHAPENLKPWIRSIKLIWIEGSCLALRNWLLFL